MSDYLHSIFTDRAVELFASWQATPSKAKSFTQIAIGTLTSSESDNPASLYADTARTQLHAEDHLDPEDPDYATSAVAKYNNTGVLAVVSEGNVAKVTALLEFNPSDDIPIRGKTVKEIGLYVNSADEGELPVYELMWIGRFPDSYVPTPEETSVTVSFNITIPILFVNSTLAAAVSTNNGSLNERLSLVETNLMSVEKKAVNYNEAGYYYPLFLNNERLGVFKVENSADVTHFGTFSTVPDIITSGVEYGSNTRMWVLCDKNGDPLDFSPLAVGSRVLVDAYLYIDYYYEEDDTTLIFKILNNAVLHFCVVRSGDGTFELEPSLVCGESVGGISIAYCQAQEGKLFLGVILTARSINYAGGSGHRTVYGNVAVLSE